MASKTSGKSAKAATKAAAGRATAGARPLPDWQGEVLSRVRRLVREADPRVVEEVKWRKRSNSMLGVPVWSHDGIICTGETYRDKVKLTFARGASVEDPAGLFNASLRGNARRAVDIHEGDEIDERAFRSLVRAAAALNASSRRASGRTGSRGTGGKGGPSAQRKGADPEPRLLSGGNPQIAKGDGDAPVQAYIAAMPGWKRDVGRRLDALVARNVPGVRKAVRWNSPFYGMEGGIKGGIGGRGWFLSYHCFTKYVKVVFLRGTSLRPLPPVESRDPNTRYFHIHEDDPLDEELLASWIVQASKLPGEPLF
jgi:hypothetical protein